MWNMPSEVTRDILSRLPAATLLRFRCVSKSWLHTIDDPDFIKLHLHRQLLNTQDSSNAVGHLILRGDFSTSLYSLSLDSLLHSDNRDKIVKPSLLKHNPCLEQSLSPRCSCNGVMLMSDQKGSNVLWNPLTGKSHRLPRVINRMSRKKTRKGLYHSVSGLGYVCVEDDYRVVRIAQVFDPRDRNLDSETLVYGLKSDSWRRIKDFPFRISRLRGGVFLEGALHWISSTTPSKFKDDLIIGLDVETEDYCLLHLPCEIMGNEKAPAKHLGVLGGCLMLSCYYQIERLDVWLMKEYGVESSWFKLFSICTRDNIGAVETLRPIAYSECEGRVLLQHDKRELIWFDLETRVGSKIRISGGPNTFSSLFCLASLVRLKDSVVD